MVHSTIRWTSKHSFMISMKNAATIFAIVSSLFSVQAFALTPPPYGPTCTIKGEVRGVQPTKIGNVDAINADVYVASSTKIKDGVLEEPTCASIEGRVLQSVSVWVASTDQYGDKVNTPFKGSLAVKDQISANVILYSNGVSGVNDVVVLPQVSQPIGALSVTLLVVTIAGAVLILVAWRIKVWRKSS